MKLDQISSSRKLAPPRILIYGGPKLGKSTWASMAPDPIFIRTEDGLDSLDVSAFPLATMWAEVMDAVGVLCAEEHAFKTVVLDSVDWAEPLCHAAVAKSGGVKSIEEFAKGFGKGYVEADKFWHELLDGLDWLRNNKAMMVILIAHDEIRKFQPPDGETYDVAGLKLHKRTTPIICEWADCIGYARAKHILKTEKLGYNKEHARAVGLDERVLTLGQNPAYLSGNRYGLPDELPLEWPAFSAALDSARGAAR